MTDHHKPHNSPQEYAEEFLGRARPALDDLFTRRGDGRVESLDTVVHSRGGESTAAVHAIALVTFRGNRFSYRRRIWLPSHPAATQAGIYATMLEERLLTRSHPVKSAVGGQTPMEL